MNYRGLVGGEKVGWSDATKVSTSELNELIDGSTDGKDNSYIGSSIPSVFARMHLIDSAFKITAKKIDANTPYKKIVSDTLDLLELIFIDRHNIQFEKFEESYGECTALNDAINQAKVDNANFVYHLIYYKIDETNKILLGATSPYTVVYTSPNLRRDLGNVKIKGLKKDYFLFGQKDCPLGDREQIFINYVFSSLKDFDSTKLYLEALTQKNKGINDPIADLNENSDDIIKPLRQLKENYFTNLLNTSQFKFAKTSLKNDDDDAGIFLFPDANTNWNYIGRKLGKVNIILQLKGVFNGI
ncbi:MAG: hypothetical protein IPQ19_13740 [Bacteroidetes bacterium]|nr:hypothetical protein [Bacteroidota bacterium]